MGFGNSNLVRRNSTLWLANQMESVPLAKTLTAHSWWAGTAEFIGFLRDERRRIHYQVSRVNLEPKELSVIAMMDFGSEPQIAVLSMHITERRMCTVIPKDSQATTFTIF